MRKGEREKRRKGEKEKGKGRKGEEREKCNMRYGFDVCGIRSQEARN